MTTVLFVEASSGGVLGGSFNALFAPVAFESFLEYPIALVLALMLRPPPDDEALPAATAEPAAAKPVTTLGYLFRPRQKPTPAATKSGTGAPITEDRRFWTLVKKWALGPVLGPLLVALLLFGMPDERPQVFRQARPAKGKARPQVRG